MAPDLPPFQRALIQSPLPGVLELTRTRAIPKLLPDQVLVRVAAVALNPCDWKMPTNFPCPGAGGGSDFSGTIIKLGDCVLSDKIEVRVGDRVAGAVHAANPLEPQVGTFAEYIAIGVDHFWKMPDTMGFAEAAAIGFCTIGTVGLAALNERYLGLPGSPEKPASRGVGGSQPWVLVYGGSTASGTMAIQILRLSGFRVITTCSPANFALVESYGAEKAFDYHSPTLSESIRAYTGNNLRYVLDIIASAKSLGQCYASIGRAGGRYVGLELVPDELAGIRKSVQGSWVLGIRLFGKEIALDGGYGFPPDPEIGAFGRDWFKRTEILVREGKIRPHPIQLDSSSGLEGVVAGLERLRQGEVRAKKLVYVL